MKYSGLTLRSFIIACVSIMLGAGLLGCASGGGVQKTHGKQADDVNVMDAFSRGEIRLTCGLPCSVTQGLNRQAMKNLHYDQAWGDLVRLVTKTEHDIDLNYYYLGRSAEGEGYIEAAKTYYQLSLKHTYKCAGWIDNCDGFVFPKDIQTRLDRMSSKMLK